MSNQSTHEEVTALLSNVTRNSQTKLHTFILRIDRSIYIYHYCRSILVTRLKSSFLS